VCVVPHVTGRALSATPNRSPRAAEGVDSIGAVASTVRIPIEDAAQPVVSDATFLDE
jgi:hypothetical protein